MSIFQRIMVTFLLFFLVPVTFVSFIAYESGKLRIIQQRAQQLESVANIQEQRIQAAVSRYLEQAQLISSRTQFSLLTSQLVNDQENFELQESISRILRDAERSIYGIDYVDVLTTEGELLLTTSQEEGYAINPLTDEERLTAQRSHVLQDVLKSDSGELYVQLTGPVRFDGQTIALVQIRADARLLLNITDDYTGLGQTGEVLLAKRNERGDAVFLTPNRFDGNASLRTIIERDKRNAPMTRALEGEEQILLGEGVIDYRDKEVLAAIRYIEGIDWGLVSKVDREEAFAELLDFQQTLIIILLVTACFAIGAAWIISRHITQPFVDLRIQAEKIQQGDFSAQLPEQLVSMQDEVGTLARTFSAMSDELRKSYKNLEAQVAKRTKDLEKSQDELEKRVEEAERLNAVMVGREKRMIELKKELKRIEKGDE